MPRTGAMAGALRGAGTGPTAAQIAPELSAILRAMKIRIDSPDLLLLEDVPWLIGAGISALILIIVGIATDMVLSGNLAGLALGLFGVAFGGLFFAAFVRRTRLELDRRSGIVDLRRRTMLGTRSWLFRLDNVERAYVEESHGDDSTTYRPMLILRDGRRQPINPVYSSGQGAARAAHAINDWLDAGVSARRPPAS